MTTSELDIMPRAVLVDIVRPILRQLNYQRYGTDCVDEEYLASLSDERIKAIIRYQTDPSPKFGPQYK